jgi:hypothetical protein
MHADNDLEPDALNDLQEMAAVGSNAKLNIVVQVDRAAGYSADPVLNLLDFETSKRLYVKKKELVELADLGELNRDKPETLADFLAWGLKTYPADRVALVLWDHGSGIGGFGGDESEAEDDNMSLPEIASALQQGLQTGGRERLDLIGFDACLMASFEVAATVAPFAEYLLASEELEPGHGWDWTSLQILVSQPGAPVPVLAKRIADDFLAYAFAAGTQNGITLSLVDLTLLDVVGSAVNAVAAQVEDSIPQSTVAVAQGVKAAFGYGKQGDPNKDIVAYDLGQLSAEFASRKVLSTEQVGTVNAALQQAVVYKVAGPPLKFATGLSIAFPDLKSEDVTAQIGVPGVAGWRSMLETFWNGGKTAPVANFASLDGTAVAQVVGKTVNVSGELKAGHGAAVVDRLAYHGVVIPEDELLAILLVEPAEQSGDLISTSWDRTYLAATSNGGSGPVTAVLSEMADGIVLLETVYWFAAGPEAGLLTLRYYMDSTGNPLGQGLYLTQNDLTAEYTPKPGDKVTPLLLVANAEGNVTYTKAPGFALDLPTLALVLEEAPNNTTLFVGLEVHSAGGEVDGVATTIAPQPVGPTDVCGDGDCTGAETAASCAADCGSSGPECGNNVCEEGEDLATCFADCACQNSSECPGALECVEGICLDLNSCEYRCGEYLEGAFCQCDAGCWDGGDCCEDIDLVCGG